MKKTNGTTPRVSMQDVEPTSLLGQMLDAMRVGDDERMARLRELANDIPRSQWHMPMSTDQH